jgi:hypothetical protein
MTFVDDVINLLRRQLADLPCSRRSTCTSYRHLEKVSDGGIHLLRRKKENSGGSTFLAGSSTRQATTYTRHRCSAVMRRKSPDTTRRKSSFTKKKKKTRRKSRHLSGVESKPDAAPSTVPARDSTPIRQACRTKSSSSNVSSTTPHLAMSSGSLDLHQDL